MLSKVALIISKAVLKLIGHFLNSPKVNNIFGLLLRVNLLNLVTLDVTYSIYFCHYFYCSLHFSFCSLHLFAYILVLSYCVHGAL